MQRTGATPTQHGRRANRLVHGVPAWSRELIEERALGTDAVILDIRAGASTLVVEVLGSAFGLRRGSSTSQCNGRGPSRVHRHTVPAAAARREPQAWLRLTGAVCMPADGRLRTIVATDRGGAPVCALTAEVAHRRVAPIHRLLHGGTIETSATGYEIRLDRSEPAWSLAERLIEEEVEWCPSFDFEAREEADEVVVRAVVSTRA